MLIVHVNVHVKPEFAEAFREVTIENARQSIQEPAIARFDFFQQQDDPTRFLLIEIYRTPDGQARHRETRHYLTWRDKVTPMMAEDRVPTRYTSVFPETIP